MGSELSQVPENANLAPIRALTCYVRYRLALARLILAEAFSCLLFGRLRHPPPLPRFHDRRHVLESVHREDHIDAVGTVFVQGGKGEGLQRPGDTAGNFR